MDIISLLYEFFFNEWILFLLSPTHIQCVSKLKSGNMSFSIFGQKTKSFDPPKTKSTVHRIIKKLDSLVYWNTKSAPILTKNHKEKRLQFCHEVMSRKENWRWVIFRKEKKNLMIQIAGNITGMICVTIER